jgi:hypothetical protein
VMFHNVGLKMLRTNFEQQQNPEDEWILASLPAIFGLGLCGYRKNRLRGM